MWCFPPSTCSYSHWLWPLSVCMVPTFIMRTSRANTLILSGWVTRSLRSSTCKCTLLQCNTIQYSADKSSMHRSTPWSLVASPPWRVYSTLSRLYCVSPASLSRYGTLFYSSSGSPSLASLARYVLSSSAYCKRSAASFGWHCETCRCISMRTPRVTVVSDAWRTRSGSISPAPYSGSLLPWRPWPTGGSTVTLDPALLAALASDQTQTGASNPLRKRRPYWGWLHMGYTNATHDGDIRQW